MFQCCRNVNLFCTWNITQDNQIKFSTQTTQSVASPCIPHLSMTLTFDLLTPRVHHLIIVNRHTKFEDAHNRQSHVHNAISMYVQSDLDLWSLTSKIDRVHPLTMVNMSAKFDNDAHNCLVSIVFKGYFHKLCVNCDLSLWHLTSRINRVHPLVIALKHVC